ncbi:MAG: hypothetical protein QM758_15560 [Armatimonas sp.]
MEWGSASHGVLGEPGTRGAVGEAAEHADMQGPVRPQVFMAHPEACVRLPPDQLGEQER